MFVTVYWWQLAYVLQCDLVQESLGCWRTVGATAGQHNILGRTLPASHGFTSDTSVGTWHVTCKQH